MTSWDALAGEVLVAAPSIDLGDRYHDLHEARILEERWSHSILRLADPSLRLILVSSHEVPPSLIRHLTDLLPDPDSARARLRTVTINDPSRRPLTKKLLERPDLIGKIRSDIAGASEVQLLAFSTGQPEHELCSQLGATPPGISPEHADFGTKSGGRKLFQAAGIPVIPGKEDLRSREDLIDAVMELQTEIPGLDAAIVKLDIGALGEGNAILELGNPQERGEVQERSSVEVLVEALPDYIHEALPDGAAVEVFLRGAGFTSPSVQVEVAGDGSPSVLASHEQLMGGPQGQAFVGCRLPASSAHVRYLVDAGLSVGAELGRRGVRGRFALDTIAAPLADGRDWSVFAVEINLREAATSAPLAILRGLVGGAYEESTGLYLDDRGIERFYKASDSLSGPGFIGRSSEEFLEALRLARLGWDARVRRGVVPYMLTSLEASGSVGAVAIGATTAEADYLYSLTSNLFAAAAPITG